MAVEIQELEVVPAEAAPEAVTPPPPPAPNLELELERAARLRWARDLRLQAD
jgi:hypothetical protein